MKTYLIAVVIIVLTPFFCPAAETNGFLVFKIERNVHSAANGSSNSSETEQAFKVPLTAEFMSNFKHVPNQNSEGTGFYCGGGFIKSEGSDHRFSWWLERTADRRWWIHMWGSGTAKSSVRGIGEPAVTQSVTIKNLEDLEMHYQVSDGGANVTFSAQYMSAAQMQQSGPIPTMPVKKADRTELFKGDISTNWPAALSGGFQEN